MTTKLTECSKTRPFPGKPDAAPFRCGNVDEIDRLFVERSDLMAATLATLKDHVRCLGCVQGSEFVPYNDAIVIVYMRGDFSGETKTKPEPVAEQIAPVIAPEPVAVEIKVETKPVATPPAVVAPAAKPVVAKKIDRVVGDAERGLLNAIKAKDALAKAYHEQAEAMIGSHDANVVFNSALKAWKKASKASRYGKAIPASEILAAFPIEITQAAPTAQSTVVEIVAPEAAIDSDAILVVAEEPKKVRVPADVRLREQATAKANGLAKARQVQSVRDEINGTAPAAPTTSAPRLITKAEKLAENARLAKANKPPRWDGKGNEIRRSAKAAPTTPTRRSPSLPRFPKQSKAVAKVEVVAVEAEAAPTIEAVAVTPVTAAPLTPKSEKAIKREAAAAQRKIDDAAKVKVEAAARVLSRLRKLACESDRGAEILAEATQVGTDEAFAAGLKTLEAEIAETERKAQAAIVAATKVRTDAEATAKVEADKKAKIDAKAADAARQLLELTTGLENAIIAQYAELADGLYAYELTEERKLEIRALLTAEAGALEIALVDSKTRDLEDIALEQMDRVNSPATSSNEESAAA